MKFSAFLFPVGDFPTEFGDFPRVHGRLAFLPSFKQIP